MTPLISVITPCYNHGQFLDELCASVQVENQPDLFEHIIINDGSTDAATINKLQELESRGMMVINQPNAGLANARNTGLSLSTGKYILPLDSDNKLVPSVMLKALHLLENNDELDVVFTDAYLFGEANTELKTSQFDLFKLLYNNYIDACALIRKSTLQKVGGYDPHMPFMGHEDWDLWISIASKRGQFFYLPEVGYHYRVAANSMLRTVTKDRQAENRRYIFQKHAAWISEVYAQLYEQEASMLEMTKYIKANRFKTIAKLLLKIPLAN